MSKDESLPRQPTVATSDVHEFGLLENGLDYVLSAAEHCRKSDARALKYAILHLFAGIELLLKDRLRREHWSLLVAEVDKTKRSDLDSGTFRSVDSSALLGRLRDVAKVEIAKNHLLHIETLRRLRNQAQHFSVSFSQAEVRSQLAMGMAFVAEFCRAHVDASPEHIQRTLDVIHRELSSFNEFVMARLTEVNPHLEGKVIWNCPRCSQDAMILGEGDPHCAFCGYSAKPWDAFFAAKADDMFTECHKCHGPCAFCDTVDGEVSVCFGCGLVC